MTLPLAQLAALYSAAPCQAHTREGRAVLDALRAAVLATKLGVRTVLGDHADVYTGPDLAARVRTDRVLHVWTGASSGLVQWDAATNWAFRAVHDCDHIVAGSPFGLEGERAACRVACARWPQLAPALCSEIVLQAAVAESTGTFPEQKVVLLDPRVCL